MERAVLMFTLKPGKEQDAEATARLRAELSGRELPAGYGPGERHPDGLRTGELLSALALPPSSARSAS